MTGRVLVTGYCGFIGKNLCRRLVEEGYAVVGADLRDASIEGVEHRGCDITDGKSVGSITDKFDTIVHLAGISSPHRAASDFKRTYDVNILGTYNVLKLHAAGGGHFIFASSSKVYGAAKRLPIGEDHPLNPLDTYGRSKVMAEGLIRSFQKETGGACTILRQFNTYGPGQADEFFVPTLLRQLRSGDELKLGNLRLRRDFLFVGDLVDAYLVLIKGAQGGLATFNVGSGKSVQLTEMVDAAAKLCGRQPKIRTDPALVRDDAAEVRSDITRLMKAGWSPKTSLSDGLKVTLEAMR